MARGGTVPGVIKMCQLAFGVNWLFSFYSTAGVNTEIFEVIQTI